MYPYCSVCGTCWRLRSSQGIETVVVLAELPGRRLLCTPTLCAPSVVLHPFNIFPASLQPDSEAFWDFSWDEMAKYDFPANINYVLGWTGRPTLTYVGHSQGTIQAFAALSNNATVAKKVGDC